MTAPFDLHATLAADTLALGDLPLCRLRLMNDARFPWLILVPRRPNLVEIFDLDAAARGQLMEEIAACAAALKAETKALKLNVAAIGNRVAQLHVHVVARFATDAVWPDPVFGRGPAVAYAPPDAAALIGALSSALELV